MPDLPSGTVTFLFTDIEGSTDLGSGGGACPGWAGQPDLLHQAAARKEGAPGDVACLVRGEEGDQVRNLLLLARPAHRYFCQRLLGLLWVVNRRRRHRRRDHAGCDVVDPPPLPG